MLNSSERCMLAIIITLSTTACRNELADRRTVLTSLMRSWNRVAEICK